MIGLHSACIDLDRPTDRPTDQSPELTMAPNSQSSEAPTYNVMNIVSKKTIQCTNGP